MKKRRGLHSSTRRPIEYVLPVVIIVLVSCLLWSLSVIRANNQGEVNNFDAPSTEPEGTVAEIEEMAGQEFAQENEAMKHLANPNPDELKAFMAAADDAGNAYDESLMIADNVCKDLASISSQISAKFDAGVDKLQLAKSNMIEARQTRQQSSAAEIARLRADNDELIQKSFEILSSKQQEDTKSKMTKFKQDISALTVERRLSNDQRFKDYLAKLFAEEDAKIASAEQEVAKFHDTAKTTLLNAQKSCARNTANAGKDFIAALKTPRLAYAETRRSAYSVHTEALEPIISDLNANGVVIRKSFEQKLQEIKPVSNIQE